MKILKPGPGQEGRRRKRTALEAELFADEKELAEHNMLVDLGRNDLGKISSADSVPEKEFEECLNKAKSSLKALKLAQEDEL